MKINFEKDYSQNTFYDCQIGDVFLFDGVPYMAVPEVIDKDPDEGCVYNAVELTTGLLTNFEDHLIVTIVDAELNIK